MSSLVATFESLTEELIPGLDRFNIVDESLLQNVIREGVLSAVTARRLVDHVVSAEQAGADLVLVTCSSVGPAVEMARPLVRIPVLRVDEPMADLAVSIGRRIGVAATLSTTLEPTAALIQARAAAAGRSVEIIPRLCTGAFEALARGDPAGHDAAVSAGLRELAGQADVIVLAQASMARVAANVPAQDRRVPILSSPRLAVERIAQMVAAR